MDELRVLLISPVRGVDPPNGDVSYTEGLLASPPDGVEYITYVDAVASGELAWVGARGSVRPVGASPLDAARALLGRKLHRLAARRRIAFREPPLTARVLGDFDLVHVHVFSVGFLGAHPPLVFSNACPTQTFYADYEQWSARRVRLATRVQSALAQLAQSRLLSAAPLPDATWVPFSEFLVRHYTALGVDARRIVIAPNSLPTPEPRATKRRNVVGFCAKSFEGKGGPAVLEAFALARRTMPDLELEMVGHPTPAGLGDLPGVRWLGEVQRSTLLEGILPTWGALVYPTKFDGSPYAVIESLAMGCPIVTVPYGAIPEMVPHRVAGWVVPSARPDHLAKGIRSVLDPERHPALVDGARRWFEAHYSAAGTRPHVLRAYRAALREASR